MNKGLLTLLTIVALTNSSLLFAGFANTDKLLASAKQEAGEMEPKALKVLIDKEEPVIVLDVRESEQRSEGEIYPDESYAITRGNLEFVIGNKVKDCKKRSKPATHREIIRPLKTVSIRPLMTEMIRPLFVKSAILY